MTMARLAALSIAVLFAAVGCGDDEAVQMVEDPAGADCPCRLATVIDNLALCVSPTTAFASTHVYSTFWNDLTREPECEPWRAPQPVPAIPWSKLRISSQCAGNGQLCVTLKAGQENNLSPDDCLLTTQCTAFDYTTPGQVAELAPLGAWVAESSECALRYEQLGGYLEFRVDSAQLGCGMSADDVTRVAVCPTRCEADPTAAGCEICGEPQIMTWF